MPLIHLTVDVSEGAIAVTRFCNEAQCRYVQATSTFGAQAVEEAERAGLVVEEQDGDACGWLGVTSLGVRALAAHDRPDTADARDKVVEAARKVCAADRALGEVSDVEGFCQNGIDVATDLLDAMPRLQDALDVLDALDAAKQGKGEG